MDESACVQITRYIASVVQSPQALVDLPRPIPPTHTQQKTPLTLHVFSLTKLYASLHTGDDVKTSDIVIYKSIGHTNIVHT